MLARSVLVAALLAYAEARFGQEQIPIPAISKVQGGNPGQAATIAGAAVSDVLAASNACDKVARADQIVSQLGGGQDAIAAAIGMLTAEKNTNPFNNNNAQKVCNDPALPATQQLRGITPLIDPAAPGAADVNALSAKSAKAPVDAAGKSIFQIISDAGFGNSVVAEQGTAKADITGASAGGNANQNANANANKGNGNANQNANQAAKNGTQAAAGNQNQNKGNGGKANQNQNKGNQNANQAQKGNQNAGNAACNNGNAAAGKANENKGNQNKGNQNKGNKNNGAQAANNGTAAAGNANKGNKGSANQNANQAQKGNKNSGNMAAENANKGNQNAGAQAANNGNAAKANKGNMNEGAQAANNGNAAKANKGNMNEGAQAANNGNAAKANQNKGNQNKGNQAGNAAACANQGNNNKNNGNAAAGNANQNKGNQNKGNKNNGNAATGNAAAKNGTAAAGNANKGNGNKGNANNGNAAAASGNQAAGNAAAGGAAQKSSIAGLDFGTCVPTIKFEGGQGNRPPTEFTFQMIDPVAAKGQQEALNPVIIGNRMCDQLTNVCNANQPAKDACQKALSDMKAAGTKNKGTADNWNTALGFAGTVTNPDGGAAEPAATGAAKNARSFRA